MAGAPRTAPLARNALQQCVQVPWWRCLRWHLHSALEHRLEVGFVQVDGHFVGASKEFRLRLRQSDLVCLPCRAPFLNLASAAVNSFVAAGSLPLSPNTPRQYSVLSSDTKRHSNFLPLALGAPLVLLRPWRRGNGEQPRTNASALLGQVCQRLHLHCTRWEGVSSVLCSTSTAGARWSV